MKKTLSTLFLFVFLLSFAQESINFENSTFKEILAKAKREKNWFSWMPTRLGVDRVN